MKIEINDLIEERVTRNEIQALLDCINVVDPEYVSPKVEPFNGIFETIAKHEKKKAKKKYKAYRVNRGDTYSFTMDDDFEWQASCTNCCMNEKS